MLIMFGSFPNHIFLLMGTVSLWIRLIYVTPRQKKKTSSFCFFLFSVFSHPVVATQWILCVYPVDWQLIAFIQHSNVTFYFDVSLQWFPFLAFRFRMFVRMQVGLHYSTFSCSVAFSMTSPFVSMSYTFLVQIIFLHDARIFGICSIVKGRGGIDLLFYMV